MRNPALAADHLRRAQVRLRTLDVLYDAESWADVVRESQEIVELALKGLLHAVGVDPPRVHDVANVLEAERDRLPPEAANDLEKLTAASRSLRRDRELAFYGAPDIVPADFYRESDASEAREMARFVVDRATAAALPSGPTADAWSS